MRLKLDENLGHEEAALLRHAGHDVDTVVDEGLTSADDGTVIQAAQGAGRCLVTLDRDFANPLRFPPTAYAGIAVLRLPRRPGHADVLNAVRTLAAGLERADVAGRLWIVQIGSLREYQPPDE